MNKEQEKAIEGLRKAINKLKKAGLTCFLAVDNLMIYEGSIPTLENKEGAAMDQFKAIDSIRTNWDGGDF